MMELEITTDLIGSVTKFARKLTKQWKNDDLIQQAFLKALTNKEKFDGKNIKAWIFTILRNEFINEIRHNQKYKYENIREFHQLNPVHADSNLIIEEINTEIDKLPHKLRIPFMEFNSGYSYNEISERNSMALGYVKSNIFKARQILKQKIQ